MLKLFFLYLNESMAFFMISYIKIPEQVNLSLLIFLEFSINNVIVVGPT